MGKISKVLKVEIQSSSGKSGENIILIKDAWKTAVSTLLFTVENASFWSM